MNFSFHEQHNCRSSFIGCSNSFIFSMASNQQQFPFAIGAGGVYNCGGPPNNSVPQVGGHLQSMGFNSGQTQNPMQPQPPNVSGAAGFQHGSGAETQGDNRMGRSERSSTVRPSSMRPNPRRPGCSRDRTGEAGPSLTPAGPQTRGEWEDQITDLTNRMLVVGTQESRPCAGCRCAGRDS